jgi:hypothetical protein
MATHLEKVWLKVESLYRVERRPASQHDYKNHTIQLWPLYFDLFSPCFKGELEAATLQEEPPLVPELWIAAQRSKIATKLF